MTDLDIWVIPERGKPVLLPNNYKTYPLLFSISLISASSGRPYNLAFSSSIESTARFKLNTSDSKYISFFTRLTTLSSGASNNYIRKNHDKTMQQKNLIHKANFSLAHSYRETRKRVIGKHSRPRSGATSCGI